MRRLGTPLYSARFCGDRAAKEVHDLDNEQQLCRIDEVIAANNAQPYLRVKDAHRDGYDDCRLCLGG